MSDTLAGPSPGSSTTLYFPGPLRFANAADLESYCRCHPIAYLRLGHAIEAALGGAPIDENREEIWNDFADLNLGLVFGGIPDVTPEHDFPKHVCFVAEVRIRDLRVGQTDAETEELQILELLLDEAPDAVMLVDGGHGPSRLRILAPRGFGNRIELVSSVGVHELLPL